MNWMQLNLNSRITWLLLLLTTNLFFSFVVWLTAPQAFERIVVMIVLFSITVALAGYWIERKKQKKLIEALNFLLSEPDEETEQIVLLMTDKFWHPIIRIATTQLREQLQMLKDKQLDLQSYQEFIEAWTHEIKTPLSLATLLLDNHKDEISPYVYKRMEHVRYTINGDVEKILYYARLHVDHVDYKFEIILLSDFLQECLEDFHTLFDEKGIDLQLSLLPIQIVSDKKVLAFMLSQILSNAFQYTASKSGIINIASWQDSQDGTKVHLSIRDNGNGVSLEDVPFLFDKGFTGTHPERQSATGMGLYFVKKYAESLSIEVNIGIMSTSRTGFEIELIFPIIV